MVLKVSGLCCSLTDRSLFTGLNFTLIQGQGLYLQGANGSGKTTLIRTIAGLISIDDGSITWHNRLIKSAADYQGELCYVGHKTACFAHIPLKENLLWHYRLISAFTNKKIQMAVKIDQALDFAGLSIQRHSAFYQLSAGQQQRFHLARLWLSLKNDLHKIWLLDEPLANVDEAAKTCYLDLCKAFIQQGGIVLMASHQDQQKIPFDQHIDLSQFH